MKVDSVRAAVERREEKRWVSSLQRGEGWTGLGERDVTDSVVGRKEAQRGRGGRDPRTENNDPGVSCSQRMAWNARSSRSN